MRVKAFTPLLLALPILISANHTAAEAIQRATTSNEETPWLAGFEGQEELFSVDGFRVMRYRSPTPETAEGGTTISTAQLRTMLDGASPPALLNVQPLPWSQGFFQQREPFQHIEGSIWIPNVGMGELDAGWAGYFRHYLARVTRGDPQQPVVIYCRADCWMSWNAIKRASDWGYTSLYWYREGVDGWRDADYELKDAVPEPYPVRSGN